MLPRVEYAFPDERRRWIVDEAVTVRLLAAGDVSLSFPSFGAPPLPCEEGAVLAGGLDTLTV